MIQVVIRRVLTAEDHDLSHIRLVYRQNDTVAGFSVCSPVSACQCHSTLVLIHISYLYHRHWIVSVIDSVVK